MGIFSKSTEPKRPVGVSFPFLEQKDGKMMIRYDSIRVDIDDTAISIVFIQEGVDIYAWTQGKGELGDLATMTLTGLEGKININIQPR